MWKPETRVRAPSGIAISVAKTRARNSGEGGNGVSIMPGVLSGLDPKPGELPMARLKSR